MSLGPFEIAIIFLVALIVIGPKRLPEIARIIGRGIHQFRKGMQDLEHAVQDTASTGASDTSRPSIDTPAPSESETHDPHPEDTA